MLDFKVDPDDLEFFGRDTAPYRRQRVRHYT